MSDFKIVEDEDSLLGILVRGCDERIFLREKSNANKYHLNPVEYANLLQRGSCTCNLLTPDGHKVADAFLESYNQKTYQDIVINQMSRIQSVLSLNIDNNKIADFDVVFGPSGSDMMYIPLLFKSMMEGKDCKIVNIITCPDELGSGSVPAGELKYYAKYNQMGEDIPIAEYIENTGATIEAVHIAARESEEGIITDRKPELREILNKYKNTTDEKGVVVNLVYASKSGIIDDLSIIDEYLEESISNKFTFVVDMCQFRVDMEIVHSLLKKNVSVMITTSKFFQAPPFCGALLVPSLLLEKISSLDAAFCAPAYYRIFSSYDFPPKLTNIGQHLTPYENKGLRVRWEVGLCEMEAYLAYPPAMRDEYIARWKSIIIGRLAQSNTFEIMPNVDDTVPTILSFKVKRVDGSSLSKPELQALFDNLALNEQQGLRDGYTKVFIGQPVAFGKKAFIRLAIGSANLRQQFESKNYDAHNDIRVIDIIENLAKTMYPETDFSKL